MATEICISRLNKQRTDKNWTNRQESNYVTLLNRHRHYDKFHNMRTIFNHEAREVEPSKQSGVGSDAVYVPH